jgi:mRNA-degrading endonuclease RelE of RelBE toxin-antitoxin system
MNVEIIVTETFRREAKKLIKKYPSLKNELSMFEDSLMKKPDQGKLILENVYKIRIAVKSKGKGKSGGLRVITYLIITKKDDDRIQVFMLSIYDKSDIENLPESQIIKIISDLQKEFQDSEAKEQSEDLENNNEIE